MIQLTQSEFRRLHNIRVNSGNDMQNISDTRLAMNLITKDTNSWIDVAKGIIRVPNTLLLYKLTLIGDSLKTFRILDNPGNKDVMYVNNSSNNNNGTDDSSYNTDNETMEDLYQEEEKGESNDGDDVDNVVLLSAIGIGGLITGNSIINVYNYFATS